MVYIKIASKRGTIILLIESTVYIEHTHLYFWEKVDLWHGFHTHEEKGRTGA